MGMVLIKTGTNAHDQESGHANGTRQAIDGRHFMTVHSYLTVPGDVSQQGETAIVDYVRRQLQQASAAVPDLSFIVEIGTER